MIIAFATTQLRDICEDPMIADAAVGKELAVALQGRLADLRAAVALEDLLAGNPRIGGPSGCELRISVGGGADLVLTANHGRMPRSEDGRVDWSKVSYVKVAQLESL